MLSGRKWRIALQDKRGNDIDHIMLDKLIYVDIYWLEVAKAAGGGFSIQLHTFRGGFGSHVVVRDFKLPDGYEIPQRYIDELKEFKIVTGRG